MLEQYGCIVTVLDSRKRGATGRSTDATIAKKLDIKTTERLPSSMRMRSASCDGGFPYEGHLIRNELEDKTDEKDPNLGMNLHYLY